MKEAIHHLVDWYQNTLATGGYPLILALMAMESTIVPLPSELIIPFAAQRAHATGSLSVVGVVIAGTIGSWLGASIMYWVSRWAGRPLVVRYGRFVMVPENKLVAAEQWCRNYGSFGVFVARLLPVVRHLIGLPMGIVKMDFGLYSLFTLLGSGLWCAVLAWVGIKAGNDPALLKGDARALTIWLGGGVLILGFLYFAFVHRAMRRPAKEL